MDTQTRLIIGLGNPGQEYAGTRHNVGFAVVEQFAAVNGIALSRRQARGICGDGPVGSARVFLLLPQTFMNLSGESVALFLRQKPVPLEHIIAVTDDIALPVGRLRLRGQGSAGGHNGLKSLIAHLHSSDFARLRVGVGAPRDAAVQRDFVLSPFARSERADIEDATARAISALETWVSEGLTPAMNQFNG